MRCALLLTLLLAVPLPARADEFVFDGPIAPPVQRWHRHRWGGYWEQDPRALLRERLDAALNLPRATGVDDWTWRDSVEDALVALGPDAAAPLQFELRLRTGYLADAIRVALFRLDHGTVDLRPALAAWADRRFPRPATESVKIMRVLGPRAILPHHLFYILEATDRASRSKRRLVVALAADGKVQDVTDDAALARFLSIELPPAKTEAAREHAAELAALLAASRVVTLYKSDADTRSGALTAEAILSAEGTTVRAALTFTPPGTVAALTTTREGTPATAAPVSLPDTTKPPPVMPE
jgi:hypothetical protein